MEKIKKFAKQKEVSRKMIIFAGLLIAVWVNFVLFGVITGSPFSLARAQNTIKIGAVVAPTSPVEKVTKAEITVAQTPLADYRTSDYRIVAAIPSSSKNSVEDVQVQTVVKNSIITFQGKSIYPNSEIFLVIRSTPIFTSVMSDSQGNWSWTNLGYPLDNGPHIIEASNVSPYDLSGKRDIFFQKYSFAVESDGNINGITELPLENLSVAGNEPVGGDIGQRFRDKNLSDTFLFDVVLLNKKEYNPGDEMDLLMNFNPLGDISKGNAQIAYEIYSHNEKGSAGTSVYSFADEVDLTQNRAYLKRIKLKEDVQSGDYFIKVSMVIGNDQYVQSAKFSIEPKTIVQIGATKIDESKFSMAITWNVGLILGLAIIIFILIIFEYRQMSVCDLVDESELRRKHYFSN